MKIGILTGPTATGKTSLALELALKCPDVEIINADSLLVYREMNIGTAKPSAQELAQVHHHLINIRNPDQAFTAGDFKREAEQAIREILERKKRPLIVGGTGFYLKTLLYGIWEAPPAQPRIREELRQKTNEELHTLLTQSDPVSAKRIGPTDPYRLIRALELTLLTGKTPTELQAEIPKDPDPRFELWIVDRSNEDLHPRIEKRARQMLRDGLIEEFQTIQKNYPESRALLSIGYTQVQHYLAGTVPEGRKLQPGLEGLSEEIQLATRQLVKRQRTWFRNQKTHASGSKWFILEESRSQLEQAFQEIYSSPLPRL